MTELNQVLFENSWRQRMYEKMSTKKQGITLAFFNLNP